MGTTWTHLVHPGTIPFEFEESKFDPMFGFEATGRKKREIDVSVAEMDSHLMPSDRRDYCVRAFMEYQACFHSWYPNYLPCEHVLHHYGQCLHEDYLIRMKEWERERRLMARAKRVGPERAGYRKDAVET